MRSAGGGWGGGREERERELGDVLKRHISLAKCDI